MNNLILVVSEGDSVGSSCWITLIVYEMLHKQMGEIFETFCVSIVTSGSLYDATNKAYEIETKLKSDNPILCGTPAKSLNVEYYDKHDHCWFPVRYSGTSSLSSEEVKRIEVDFNSAKWNPDAYFKPLDIAMIFNDKEWVNEYVHTCIYLGGGKVCHALGGNKVRIENWSNFFSILPSTNKMLRYHPTIAFKKTDEIIKHIANCAEGETNYYDNLKKGPFRIRVDSDGNSNNCESFVNRCVLGLNFSELAERKKENNNSRVMNLDIEEQLSKTRGDLDSLTSYTPWSTVNEIKGHRRASGYEDFTLMRDGIAMESRVEAQPKVNLFKDLIN